MPSTLSWKSPRGS